MMKPMMKILLVAVKTASKCLYSSHEGCWDPKFEPSVEDIDVYSYWGCDQVFHYNVIFSCVCNEYLKMII